MGNWGFLETIEDSSRPLTIAVGNGEFLWAHEDSCGPLRTPKGH